MALHTTADILLNSTLEKVSQGLSPKLWINNTGATSYASLKTASQKQPSNFNVSIPIQYDTTYVISIEENGGSSYFSAAEMFSKLDNSIQSMVDAIAALYTVTITTWSAEILDYKIQSNAAYDGTTVAYNVGLIAQINLYVA
jgi:hypothetical protein